MQADRPKHLALWKIRQPLPAIVSILHRVSGAALFVMIPFLLYVLDGSLASAARFESFHSFISHPLIKLVLLGLFWAFMHHACAGVRFLLLDAHKGLDLKVARLTAMVVMAVSLSLTAVVGGLAW